MIIRLLLTAAVIFALIVFMHYLPRILAALKRFDESNARRQQDEVRDRTDTNAHFRHTLQLAEERVEQIHEIIERDRRTGTDVVHHLFHGKIYTTRAEAEAARAEAVRVIARQFYSDLPRALRERRDDDQLN